MTILANPNLSSNKKLQQSAGDIENAAINTAHTLRDAAKDTGNAVREFVHETTDQAMMFRKTAEEKITENPMKSVAIAALGGLLLGAILRR